MCRGQAVIVPYLKIIKVLKEFKPQCWNDRIQNEANEEILTNVSSDAAGKIMVNL